MGFFKSFFGGKSETAAEEKQKSEQKNFEIFKYDGLRAQRMGRRDYAVKCYQEALAIQKDFETMGYLAQIYAQTNEHEEARRLLEEMVEMEPGHTVTLLNLSNICFILEDYPAMTAAAKRIIEQEPENATAYYLLAKACEKQNDGIMCIAHLTKAIMLKEDFITARQLRAEMLCRMQQPKEAMEDIGFILSADAEDEDALLLRAQISQAEGREAEAETDYRQVIELNPFNQQAFLLLGKLYMTQGRKEEAAALAAENIGDSLNEVSGEYGNQPGGMRQTDVLGL